MLPPIVDLTWPSHGSRTVHQLLSLALGRAHAVVNALGTAGPLDPRTALRAGGLAGAPLLASLRRPSRLTLARCLEFAPSAPAAERLRWARHLAAWLCLDGAEAGLGARVAMSDVTELRSERSGWIVRLPAGARVTLAPHWIEVATPAGTGHAALPASTEVLAQALEPAGVSVEVAQVPLWGDVSLLLVDSNPLALQEAHPAKNGNRVDLGGEPLERWRAALIEAFGVIESTLPVLADEMRLLLGHVGPVGFFDEQHLSASYLEATGVIYLSLHPHGMTLVEALIHEFQHNKLNLLLGLDPVLHNADAPLYTSPVRPDPRPLRGVLLAVHAFEPIARLHDRLITRSLLPDEQPREVRDAAPDDVPVVEVRLTTPHHDARMADWHRVRRAEVARLCHEGCEVLVEHARPTTAGAELISEIAGLDAETRRWVPGV